MSNYIGFRDIKEDLLRNGMREENIIVLKDYIKKSSENKYFEDACIYNIKKGFFVDCGCYDGSNTINYINKYGLDHAVAVEADYKNYLICKQNLSNYSNVRVYNLGVSDKKEIKKFDMRASSASNFTDTGNVEVHTDTLDNLIGNESVGFIKMDIEGFEEKAIIGSQNIIRNQKPMLAVCMYHKREDFWRIPNILLELNKDYKFYLRHYSISANETILYCV